MCRNQLFFSLAFIVGWAGCTRGAVFYQFFFVVVVLFSHRKCGSGFFFHRYKTRPAGASAPLTSCPCQKFPNTRRPARSQRSRAPAQLPSDTSSRMENTDVILFRQKKWGFRMATICPSHSHTRRLLLPFSSSHTYAHRAEHVLIEELTGFAVPAGPLRHPCRAEQRHPRSCVRHPHRRANLSIRGVIPSLAVPHTLAPHPPTLVGIPCVGCAAERGAGPPPRARERHAAKACDRSPLPKEATQTGGGTRRAAATPGCNFAPTPCLPSSEACLLLRAPPPVLFSACIRPQHVLC